MSKKILIFKNDRGGDLVSSVRLIYKLIKNNSNISIYLSNVNYDFRFLLGDLKIKKINFNLSFFDKFKIFFDLIKNKYEEVYILTPKNFYYYMPLIFRKTKFFAITINGKKRDRPIQFLRKYLYKYSIAYRTKLNKKNIIQNQLSLIDAKEDFDYHDLKLNKINNNIAKKLPNNFAFFQFKKSFFDQLKWSTNEFEKITQMIADKYKFVIFSSDIENNYYDSYFIKNYTTIDFQNQNSFLNKNTNVIYLRKVDPENLCLLIKMADKVICPHGLVTQIAYLFNKKSVNLFGFKINNIDEYHHQKFSFSEWYSNMKITFVFLNSNIDKAVKKISKFI
tara:strand:+ start:2466 stop:3470 length:1005 start_codon:yes stop_codon:yes gene_type:complete